MKLWTDQTVWIARGARRRAAALSARDIKSIAIIKHAALGDMLLTRPFLITLREHFPSAKLTLSVVSHYQQGLPLDLVDRLHVAHGKNRRDTSVWQRLKSFKELGEQDLIFDITSNARSFWMMLLNRAALKIGFIPRGAHKFSHWVLYDVALPRGEYKFEAETFLDQLNVLGLMPSWPLRFDLAKEAPVMDKKYLAYFVGASDPYKCWPAEKFSELLKQMVEKYPEYQHVVLAGLQDWEKGLARQVADACKGSEQVTLCCNPERSWSVVQGADVLVTNDTGVRNYAIAAGTPTVGIFTATLPFRYLPRFGRHRAVYNPDGGIPEVAAVFGEIAQLLG